MDSWENINAVERMQSYIEAHLHEPITLYNLANTAGYSPWHAAKIFKALTGKSPFEYIRALRLSQAAIRLVNEDIRIVDVAFDFVFDSHEGFTRAFSKQFGVTPQRYSQDRPPIKLFIPNIFAIRSSPMKKENIKCLKRSRPTRSLSRWWTVRPVS